MSGQKKKAPPLRFSLPPTESSGGGRLSSAADGRARTPAAPWKRNRFIEIAMRKSTMGNAAALPRVEYEDVIPFSGYFNNDIFAKSSDKIGVQFSEGDVLFGKLRPYLGNWMLAEFKGLAVGDWWVLKSTGVVSEFLYTLIQTPSFQDVANQSVGSKMPRADWSLVSEALFYCPNNPVEQHRIGSFFRTVDVLIAVREKALGKLEALKKSMLLKMFPQGDALVPAVRFKGFAGNWEKTRLGNFGDCQSGEGFPEIEQGGNAGVPFFKVSDMNLPGNKSELIYANNYVTEEQIRRCAWHPVVKLPAIIFAKVGAAVMLNRKRIVRKRFLLDNNTMAFRLDDSIDVDFAKSLFDTIDLPALSQASALPSINASDVEHMLVMIPLDHVEQQKIGAYFRSLDALIAARREEVEKLRQMKKALLERMFV